MKKMIGVAVLGAALLVPAVAQAHDGEGGQLHTAEEVLWDDWNRASKLRAPKGTACGTARAALYRWMDSDTYRCPITGNCNIRIGRDGVLWKCSGNRAYGKLNPVYVNCWSSQKQWHYNKYGSWYTTKSMWFEYRD